MQMPHLPLCRKKGDAADAEGLGPDAVPPKPKRQRVRKRTPESSDGEDNAAEAYADSDPDFSDDAAPKKRKRASAPRKPRAPKATKPAGGRGGGRAGPGRGRGARAAKAEKPLESDVEFSDLDDGE